MARANARASFSLDLVLQLVSGGVPARQQGPPGWPCCNRAGRRVDSGFRGRLGFRQCSVELFRHFLGKVRARQISELSHPVFAKLAVEPCHLSLEHGLSVPVRCRIAAHDVPGVCHKLVADRTGYLVLRLSPIDHRPAPFADARLGAEVKHCLPGFTAVVFQVSATFAVKRLARAAFSLGPFLFLPACVDCRGKPGIGRELCCRRESARVFDKRLKDKRRMEIEARQLH